MMNDETSCSLLAESGDTLFPVEIKETKSSSQIAKRQFSVVDQLGRSMGSGVVLCMAERDFTLSLSLTAVSMGYL